MTHTENLIRAALATGTTRLIALREALGDVNRHEVDAALLAMHRAGEIYTYPESRQGDLTQLERDLALRVGSTDHHLIDRM